MSQPISIELEEIKPGSWRAVAEGGLIDGVESTAQTASQALEQLGDVQDRLQGL